MMLALYGANLYYLTQAAKASARLEAQTEASKEMLKAVNSYMASVDEFIQRLHKEVGTVPS